MASEKEIARKMRQVIERDNRLAGKKGGGGSGTPTEERNAAAIRRKKGK